MNMDTRIETKYRPQYGCHSELTERTETCEVEFDHIEKACEGCTRKKEEPDCGG